MLHHAARAPRELMWRGRRLTPRGPSSCPKDAASRPEGAASCPEGAASRPEDAASRPEGAASHNDTPASCLAASIASASITFADCSVVGTELLDAPCPRVDRHHRFGALFDSKDELIRAAKTFAKDHGYALCVRRSWPKRLDLLCVQHGVYVRSNGAEPTHRLHQDRAPIQASWMRAGLTVTPVETAGRSRRAHLPCCARIRWSSNISQRDKQTACMCRAILDVLRQDDPAEGC